MSCDSCASDRIAKISGKCSDMFQFETEGIEYNGYVPINLGVGDGDYIRFSYCLDCGKIQNSFPITNEDVKKGTKQEEGEE